MAQRRLGGPASDNKSRKDTSKEDVNRFSSLPHSGLSSNSKGGQRSGFKRPVIQGVNSTLGSDLASPRSGTYRDAVL